MVDEFDTRDRRRLLQPGDVLARQGDEADEVFVVVDGESDAAYIVVSGRLRVDREVVKARLARRPSPYPGLPGVLVRSLLVGAVRDRNRVMESGAIDLYIDVEMPEIGLLEFENVRPTVERGYLAGAGALDGWLEAPVSDRG